MMGLGHDEGGSAVPLYAKNLAPTVKIERTKRDKGWMTTVQLKYFDGGRIDVNGVPLNINRPGDEAQANERFPEVMRIIYEEFKRQVREAQSAQPSPAGSAASAARPAPATDGTQGPLTGVQGCPHLPNCLAARIGRAARCSCRSLSLPWPDSSARRGEGRHEFGCHRGHRPAA
jgi:hypothetical protein